ncbi:MAG: hypothetical protein ABIQ88_19920 [Chitinophagaceae bacterium]
MPSKVFNDSKDDYDFFYPKVFASYVLTIKATSYRGQVNLLATEIANLTKHLRYEHLIFLGDEKTPWLDKASDYKSAMGGLEFLIANKVGKRFNGALLTDIANLPTFIKHLTWLIRSNTLLPYVHFMDKGQNIVGSICQYGNLHIDSLNKRADRFLKDFVSTSQFDYVFDKRCSEKYSKTGIKGRQISV